MKRVVFVASALMVLGAASKKMSSFDQGAEFTQCISIADFEGKTLDDDITLIDRESGGCCPKGSVPGAKWTNNYQSPMVVCGFKADGSVAWSTGSSNGAKTCTYNKCYVYKQYLKCTGDDEKQRLNGCCKDTTGANTGFGDLCMNYYSSFNNVYNEKVQYCTTFHKNYGTLGWKGTQAKTDDQEGGKLVPSNIYTYTPCEGGGGGSGGGSGAIVPALTVWPLIVAAFVGRL